MICGINIIQLRQRVDGAASPRFSTNCYTRDSFWRIRRRTLLLLMYELENIVAANRAVWKETVHRILFVFENFEYRVQFCEDHQAQMKRHEINQFQRPAGPHNPCVTVD